MDLTYLAGSERLGEMSALCIERVLALAQSVSAFARFRRPSDDGIKWPDTPKAIAVLLCVQVCRALRSLPAIVRFCNFQQLFNRAAQACSPSQNSLLSCLAAATRQLGFRFCSDHSETLPQAKRMEADLLSVASVFSSALHGAVGAFSEEPFAVSEEAYGAATAALEKDAATAIARLQESLRGLMYIVLLTGADHNLL